MYRTAAFTVSVQRFAMAHRRSKNRRNRHGVNRRASTKFKLLVSLIPSDMSPLEGCSPEVQCTLNLSLLYHPSTIPPLCSNSKRSLLSLSHSSSPRLEVCYSSAPHKSLKQGKRPTRECNNTPTDPTTPPSLHPSILPRIHHSSSPSINPSILSSTHPSFSLLPIFLLPSFHPSPPSILFRPFFHLSSHISVETPATSEDAYFISDGAPAICYLRRH